MPLPGQLASIPPLPSGGIKTVTPQTTAPSVLQPPEIDDARVDRKNKPFGEQLISENIQMRAQTITRTQLLALKGSDIILAEAPGPGLSIDVEGVSVRINFGTAAYVTTGASLKVFLGASTNGNAVSAELATILAATATSDIIGSPGLATGVITAANAENQALFLGNTGANNFTTGDGTLDVIVTYATLQM